MYKLILQSSRRSGPKPGASGPERIDGCSPHDGAGAAARCVHRTAPHRAEKCLLLPWTYIDAAKEDNARCVGPWMRGVTAGSCRRQASFTE